MTNHKGKIIFLCTEDWYFWSHRLPIARAARGAGLHVIVVTRVQAHGQRLLAEGFDVRALGWRRRGDGLLGSLRALIAICRLYRRERPQLVHHIALKAVIFGAVAAFFARVPHQVNAIAGLGFVFASPSLRATITRFAILQALRLFVRRQGSVIITQNADDAEELIARKVIFREQVSVIRGSGVDLNRFRLLPERPGQVVVAMVSRMLRYKGIEVLVRAAQLLHDRGMSVRCYIVGPLDPDSPGSLLEEELRSWMQPGLIEWLGPLEDVVAIWEQAHIAVLPSIYREGVPLALLEAAACGRPIVSTDAPGCRDVVLAGVNGFLIAQNDSVGLADAIERLAGDPAMRVRMGREGRQRVERYFQKDIIVAQTLELYSAALRYPLHAAGATMSAATAAAPTAKISSG